MLNNRFITTFFKISIITTALFGGLLAQSYATNLVSDSIMRMNIEFAADNKLSNTPETASVLVQNNQQSDFSFGNHQLEIKTTFIENKNLPASEQQFLAEVKIKQLGESGEINLIGSPSMLILRNKWAEFKLNTADKDESIQFKLQFEEDDTANEEAMLAEPEWLNWGDKQSATKVC